MLIGFSMKQNIPQIQLGLLYTLNCTLELAARGGSKRNFTMTEMISILPSTITLHVATFQQYLHIEYMY
jgi:hypothetical protein